MRMMISWTSLATAICIFLGSIPPADGGRRAASWAGFPGQGMVRRDLVGMLRLRGGSALDATIDATQELILANIPKLLAKASQKTAPGKMLLGQKETGCWL